MAESPPWGSLDAAIAESYRLGKPLPPLIADAVRGRAADGKPRVLVLSSGGQYGAFGAGVIAGWTGTGQRPEFDVVTGLSVGSILAPVAFLGPDHDEALTQMVRKIAAAVDRYPLADIGPFDLLGAIWGRGFPVSAEIETLLRSLYDDAFVDQVAREHADGRNLYVGSTDVTAGKVTVWDLGAIAASGNPDRVQRFQDAILASIAVPVAMPARYIETGQDGTYALHVDGSFLAPIFISALTGNFDDLPNDVSIYVVVNNKLRRPQPLKVMSPRLVDLVPRLFYLVHTSQFERTMDLLLLKSQMLHFTVRILTIPEDENLRFSMNFSSAEIDELFKLGMRTGADADAWQELPAAGLPDYWAPPQTAEIKSGAADAAR
jgi:predicted acylesterase/phospholipase RssA